MGFCSSRSDTLAVDKLSIICKIKIILFLIRIFDQLNEILYVKDLVLCSYLSNIGILTFSN